MRSATSGTSNNNNQNPGRGDRPPIQPAPFFNITKKRPVGAHGMRPLYAYHAPAQHLPCAHRIRGTDYEILTQSTNIPPTNRLSLIHI